MPQSAIRTQLFEKLKRPEINEEISQGHSLFAKHHRATTHHHRAAECSRCSIDSIDRGSIVVCQASIYPVLQENHGTAT